MNWQERRISTASLFTSIFWISKLVRKHTDIHELTAEIIREFVEKIYIYNKEIVDGKRIQRIKIVWNFIGEFPLYDTIPIQTTSTTSNNHSKEKST